MLDSGAADIGSRARAAPASRGYERHSFSDVGRLEGLWNGGQRYQPVAGGRVGVEIEAQRFDFVVLQRETLTGDVLVHRDPSHQWWTFGLPMRAGGRVAGRMADGRYLTIVRPGEGLTCRSHGPCDYLQVAVTTNGFRGLAKQHHEGLAKLADGSRFLKLPKSAQDEIRRLGDVLRESNGGGSGTSRLVETGVLEALFAALRLGIPEAGQRRNLRHGQIFQRAVAFFEARASEAVTIPEVCEAVGASQRVVEYCFRDYAGLTPIRYLKLHRLAAVRRNLVAAGADTRVTVTAVALDFGFGDLSHFAAEYKALFDESPSTTLRRARRGKASSRWIHRAL